MLESSCKIAVVVFKFYAEKLSSLLPITPALVPGPAAVVLPGWSAVEPWVVTDAAWAPPVCCGWPEALPPEGYWVLPLAWLRVVACWPLVSC